MKQDKNQLLEAIREKHGDLVQHIASFMRLELGSNPKCYLFGWLSIEPGVSDSIEPELYGTLAHWGFGKEAMINFLKAAIRELETNPLAAPRNQLDVLFMAQRSSKLDE
jgi:hypothetical protein